MLSASDAKAALRVIVQGGMWNAFGAIHGGGNSILYARIVQLYSMHGCEIANSVSCLESVASWIVGIWSSQRQALLLNKIERLRTQPRTHPPRSTSQPFNQLGMIRNPSIEEIHELSPAPFRPSGAFDCVRAFSIVINVPLS
jgi:hypothetical protein